jgi:multidrug efflux system outer membrane protein
MSVRLASLRRTAISTVLAGSISLVLAACAVGPDYERPAVANADEFVTPAAVHLDNREVEREFWKTFDDALLTELIEDSLRANHDVRIALSHLNEARALRGEAQFDVAPTVTASAGAVEARASERQNPIPNADRNQDYYDASFDAFWELDFFGRVRRGLEAQSALVQAAEAELYATQVTVTAEVARNYFELRGAQERLAVARRNASNQEESLRITRARLEGGRGTQLDVSRAQSLLSATRATIPDLEAAVTYAMLRLGVLTGRSPEALMDRLADARPLPALPQTHRIGTPESLLRRRPDIQVAERQLAAATAQVGIAVADLFPRISFVGRWGFDAASSADLGDAASESYAFGPSIQWAAFDLGRVRKRIDQREAAADGALARYEQSVLRALEETDASLTAYAQALVKQQHLRQSAASSAEAATIARARFESGVTDFLTVLDAERTMLEAEDRLAASETQTATALLSMYKALGGGFRPVEGGSMPRLSSR